MIEVGKSPPAFTLKDQDGRSADGKVAHHWRRARAKGHAEQVRNRLGELRG